MIAPSIIVIDASLAAKAVIPGAPQGDEVLKRVAGWHLGRARLVAPDIWLPEVVSVVRQAIYLRLITPEAGKMATEDIFRLGVEVIPSDLDQCQSALAWAERLGQSKAYDGFYLALAERLSAERLKVEQLKVERLKVELWTGDGRLFNRAHQLGVDWVRSLTEEFA